MILLTGATGFLGRNLVPRLLHQGYQLRALVRPSSDVVYLKSVGVELAYAEDITDETAVAAACVGCEQVIHLAGLFRFWGDVEEFRHTNVHGTKVVLEGALKANVKRFLHISTIALIGATPPNGIMDENSPCNPQEPYQMSKLEGEQLALSYVEKGLPVIVVRPGALFGPWGRYAFNRLFFEEPLRGWRIKVDHGRNITFPVFAPDAADGIVLALKNGRIGEIYHISGESLSHNTVNGIVSDLADIAHWRIHIPKTAVLLLARAWTALSKFTRQEPFYPINMASYVFQDWPVSIEKARKELEFEPTPFKKAVQITLDWYWSQGIIRKK